MKEKEYNFFKKAEEILETETNIFHFGDNGAVMHLYKFFNNDILVSEIVLDYSNSDNRIPVANCYFAAPNPTDFKKKIQTFIEDNTSFFYEIKHDKKIQSEIENIFHISNRETVMEIAKFRIGTLNESYRFGRQSIFV